MAGKINSSLLKVLYEVCGESEEDIAAYFGVSTTLVRYAVEEANLKQTQVAQTAHDWTTLDVVDVTDDVIQKVRDRIRVLQTLKLSAQNPQYIALESAILAKLQDIIINLPAQGPGLAGTLKEVVSTLSTLRQLPIGPPEVASPDESANGTKVQINILGQVGADYQTASHAQVRIQGADDGMGQVLP